MSVVVPPGYYDRLARVESGNNPFARAGSSSASGLYQFTRGTWEGLGFQWSDVFNTDKQNSAIQRLTAQNATQLLSRGITPDAGSLYAAHFLGGGTASKVYGADPSSPISSLVSRAQMAANPSVFKDIKTAGDFRNWASGKMGSTVSKAGETVGKAVGVAKDAATVAALVASGNWAAAAQYAVTSDTPQGASDTGNVLTKFIEWIKGIFSANTAARAVAILVGLILVGGAIIALTGTDKVIVETAKSVAKTAAVAA